MKNLKTILLAFVALLAVQGAMAQTRERTVVKSDSTTVITIVKRHIEFLPKHDIRLGVGAVSLSTYFLLDEGNGYYDGGAYYDFRGDMAIADTYCTPRLFLGNYTLSYTYHDRHWLQYGGTAVFGVSTCWRRDSFTGKKVENLTKYSLALMPTVRFNWFYRECVQLYSSLSVAFVTDFDGLYMWGDATLLGCSVGRKFFGFAELGMGMSGWVRAGIGFCFNAVKK